MRGAVRGHKGWEGEERRNRQGGGAGERDFSPPSIHSSSPPTKVNPLPPGATPHNSPLALPFPRTWLSLRMPRQALPVATTITQSALLSTTSSPPLLLFPTSFPLPNRPFQLTPRPAIAQELAVAQNAKARTRRRDRPSLGGIDSCGGVGAAVAVENRI